VCPPLKEPEYDCSLTTDRESEDSLHSIEH